MTMYALGYGSSPEEATRALLAELEKVNAVRMVASYSGGNDEGGVDEITLFDAEGREIDIALGWEHPLQAAADDLLSSEYGSWAGEFHAGGNLNADTRSRRAWTSDNYYEVPTNQPDVGNIEVQL